MQIKEFTVGTVNIILKHVFKVAYPIQNDKALSDQERTHISEKFTISKFGFSTKETCAVFLQKQSYESLFNQGALEIITTVLLDFAKTCK